MSPSLCVCSHCPIEQLNSDTQSFIKQTALTHPLLSRTPDTGTEIIKTQFLGLKRCAPNYSSRKTPTSPVFKDCLQSSREARVHIRLKFTDVVIHGRGKGIILWNRIEYEKQIFVLSNYLWSNLHCMKLCRHTHSLSLCGNLCFVSLKL